MSFPFIFLNETDELLVNCLLETKKYLLGKRVINVTAVIQYVVSTCHDLYPSPELFLIKAQCGRIV